MSSHKHHPVYRTGELESELEVARSLTKEALAQVAAKDAALREIIDLIKACKGRTAAAHRADIGDRGSHCRRAEADRRLA